MPNDELEEYQSFGIQHPLQLSCCHRSSLALLSTCCNYEAVPYM